MPALRRLMLTLAAGMAALCISAPGATEHKGSVGFSGAVTESSCAISTPSRSWLALPAEAMPSREVPFSVNVEVCAPHVFDATDMNLIGQPDDDDSSVLALVRTDDAAQGIGIAIHDASGGRISPNAPLPSAAFSRLSDRVVMLPLRARYTATRDSLSPGKISSLALIAVEHY